MQGTSHVYNLLNPNLALLLLSLAAVVEMLVIPLHCKSQTLQLCLLNLHRKLIECVQPCRPGCKEIGSDKLLKAKKRNRQRQT